MWQTYDTASTSISLDRGQTLTDGGWSTLESIILIQVICFIERELMDLETATILMVYNTTVEYALAGFQLGGGGGGAFAPPPPLAECLPPLEILLYILYCRACSACPPPGMRKQLFCPPLSKILNAALDSSLLLFGSTT